MIDRSTLDEVFSSVFDRELCEQHQPVSAIQMALDSSIYLSVNVMLCFLAVEIFPCDLFLV